MTSPHDWVYTGPRGAAIERYVPTFALSRDVERFKTLRESLALYRMVFGQLRQEEPSYPGMPHKLMHGNRAANDAALTIAV